VLGIGTTLGIVAQTLVLLPAMRRIGFRYRPVWGWDSRMTATGGLALWAIAYVLIGAIGLNVTTQVATAADGGAYVVYANSWLLLQVPYGVLGVSLLTALMPRMSRAAAEVYPGPRFLKMFHDAGVPITLASDAHVPADAGWGHAEVVAAAREAGYTHRLRFENRERTLVPLEDPPEEVSEERPRTV